MRPNPPGNKRRRRGGLSPRPAAQKKAASDVSAMSARRRLVHRPRLSCVVSLMACVLVPPLFGREQGADHLRWHQVLILETGVRLPLGVLR